MSGAGRSESIVGDLEARAARKVVSHSLRLKKGESVTVETWKNGLALACRSVVEARRMGATPPTIFGDEDTYVEGVKNTPEDSVGRMGRRL